MKTVKTSELTGIALCYAVAMIEMPKLLWGETIGIHHASHQIVVPSLPEPDCYSPFSNWKMLGPIIEREGFSIEPFKGRKNDWRCFGFKHGEVYAGNTPLIAAMRCYVASKLGDEVDVPDEVAS